MKLTAVTILFLAMAAGAFAQDLYVNGVTSRWARVKQRLEPIFKHRK